MAETKLIQVSFNADKGLTTRLINHKNVRKTFIEIVIPLNFEYK